MHLGNRATTANKNHNFTTAARSNKNNVLFLFADEMDGRILDPDSPQIKPPLPNLHQLAASGAVFKKCYSQSPQCVPSRSAMMVGLRTDQIEVYDNFVGIASTNGNSSQPDSDCVRVFGHDACVAFGESQQAPPTFIDRLASAGYNISLFGKMHVGAGLTRFNGQLNAFPFNAGSSNKALREWTRGLGPETNTKGVPQSAKTKWDLHSKLDLDAPATRNDYEAIDHCLGLLRSGLLSTASSQFLYCSILVPHPPYQTNATYMQMVEKLDIHVPAQVPKSKLHPNDVATATLKGTFDADSVPTAEIELFRRVYFSMCYEADTLLGSVIDALDASGGRRDTFIIMISDHVSGACSILDVAEFDWLRFTYVCHTCSCQAIEDGNALAGTTTATARRCGRHGRRSRPRRCRSG